MKPLLILNGEEYDIKEAIEIDILHENKFLNSTIENLLIRQYCEKIGISNTDEELQVALDELRYNRNLESVEKTLFWLKNNNITIEGVQSGVDIMILRNKLRNSFTAEEIESYFAENKLSFDKVELFSLRLDTMAKAEEVYSQITEDCLNFYVGVMAYSTDETTCKINGFVGFVGRKDVTGEIEAAIFNPLAHEEYVLRPIKTDKGYNIFKIGTVLKADLAKEKSNIQFALFNNLMNKLKAEAKITYPILED
jgi:hypothetical protein